MAMAASSSVKVASASDPSITAEIRAKVPTMTWSQKKDHVYFTIKLPDCVDHTLDIQPSCVHFQGTSAGEKYEFKADLFGSINPAESRSTINGQCIKIDLVIDNANAKKGGKMCKWSRLTKQCIKIPTLKVDMTDMDMDSDSDMEGLEEDDPCRNFEQAMLKGIGAEIPAAAPPPSSSDSEDERENVSSDDELVFVPRNMRGGRGGGRGRGDGHGRGNGYARADVRG